MLTAKEASELAGITKSGLIKAIHSGKVSAQRDEQGSWILDPAEVLRVWPPASTVNGDSTHEVDNSPQEVDGESTQTLRAENALLRQMVADKDQLITWLQGQLELAQKKEMALLPGPSKNWWQRLLGGGA